MKLFSNKSTPDEKENASLIEALNRAQAMIWFELDGTILDANDNFLATIGYTKDEIVGKHHRMFVEKDEAESAEYKEFWKELARGSLSSGEFKRIHKNGSKIWLEASYNPILDANGNPVKVVKFATDVTDVKQNAANALGQLDAISASLAVIEFDLDGVILTANDNFCKAMGYECDEIIGQHHSMFVDDNFSKSEDYANFWTEFKSGTFQTAEFKRLGKGGKKIWIQATYAPIRDSCGDIFKVVKYARDITDRKQSTDIVKQHLQRLAQGDLSAKIASGVSDEFQDVADAFNATLDHMSTLVTDIKGTSATMREGTARISEGAKQLSARTIEQAAALEETNASMEEMSSNIRSSAQNANKANDAANEANSKAAQGDTVVTSAISAMERIEEGSNRITEIITVIESIAFQTNLLALNAAVEAARAGESGKGFAVVASEVRTLAQRSSEAARDITSLIDASSAQVSEGAELVRNTGKVLTEIRESISSVAQSVESISGTSIDQANGVKEISQVVSDIDSNTQKNAELAHISSSEAVALEQQAEHLTKLVSIFSSPNEEMLDKDWENESAREAPKAVNF